MFLLVINEFCGCFGLISKVYCGWNWFCFGNHGRNETNLPFFAENRESVPVPGEGYRYLNTFLDQKLLATGTGRGVPVPKAIFGA